MASSSLKTEKTETQKTDAHDLHALKLLLDQMYARWNSHGPDSLPFLFETSGTIGVQKEGKLSDMTDKDKWQYVLCQLEAGSHKLQMACTFSYSTCLKRHRMAREAKNEVDKAKEEHESFESTLADMARLCFILRTRIMGRLIAESIFQGSELDTEDKPKPEYQHQKACLVM